MILFLDGWWWWLWWGWSFHRNHNRLVERSAVNVCSTKRVSLARIKMRHSLLHEMHFPLACAKRISWRFVLISLQLKSIWNRLVRGRLARFFQCWFFPAHSSFWFYCDANLCAKINIKHSLALALSVSPSQFARVCTYWQWRSISDEKWWWRRNNFSHNQSCTNKQVMEIIFFVLLSIFYHIDLVSSFAVFTLFRFNSHFKSTWTMDGREEAMGALKRVWFGLQMKSVHTNFSFFLSLTLLNSHILNTWKNSRLKLIQKSWLSGWGWDNQQHQQQRRQPNNGRKKTEPTTMNSCSF